MEVDLQKRKAEYEALEAERHARIAEDLRLEKLRRKEIEEKNRLQKIAEAEKEKAEQLELQKLKDNLQQIVESEIDSYIDDIYVDPFGDRWYKCTTCGKVAKQKEFGIYGGPHQAARGICFDCNNKKSNEIDFEIKKKTVRKNENDCPWCGNALVKRVGPYGPFWGCSAYPNCTFNKKI